MSDGTYSLNLRCTNCRHHWTAKIQLGTQFTTMGPGRQTCPKCQCQTVIKDADPTMLPVQYPSYRGPWL